MDQLDQHLLAAWNTVSARLRTDRLDALRRAFRRASPTLSRPVRPWCLALRAADTRLAWAAYVPKYAPDLREPHDIVADSDTLRDLCKPVHLPWPGIDWTHAADRLGRHPESLRGWIRRGILRSRTCNARSVGKGGRPVPFVWSPAPLDPNADFAQPPDPLFGTLWQYLHERIPDGLEFTLRRIPRDRPDPRGSRHPAGRACGWSFLCPGLPTAMAASLPSPAPGGRGWPPAGGAAGRPGEGALSAGPPCARTDPQEEHRVPLFASCNRRVDRLFLPLRPWTLLDALGIEDPLDITLPSPAHPTPPAACSQPDPSPLPLPIPHSPSPLFLACHHCHRIRYISFTGRDGWNLLITHLTAGLLYGHEVPRPQGLTTKRKRRYVPHVRQSLPLPLPAGEGGRRLGGQPAGRERVLPIVPPLPPRRAQVLALLRRGLTYNQIADRMGIKFSTVHGHIKRLYKQHNAHSRTQLLSKLTFPAANRPSTAARRTG